ncbi:DUF397 domain-containing protein [Streptomyces diastaticus]|uniref:DUF397 domain-containing protein n=2 Tax=Streptomyces diastaticus TaxID=1956 RepID=UPI00365E5F7C
MYKNGMSSTAATGASWVKASISDAIGGNCVELSSLPDGSIAFRNSRDTAGPALVFTTDEFDAFLDGAKKGEFDSLTV